MSGFTHIAAQHKITLRKRSPAWGWQATRPNAHRQRQASGRNVL